MRSLVLLIFYSLGLFLVSYFLLDVEGMMVNAFASQADIEIPENVVVEVRVGGFLSSQVDGSNLTEGGRVFFKPCRVLFQVEYLNTFKLPALIFF